MAAFILVHSPLVGASTWWWVGQALRARGQRVTVPAVPPSVVAAGWRAFADHVAAHVAAELGDEDPAVLAGHSGAGPLLPQIRARARRTSDLLLFVDAGVPPETGEAELVPPDLLAGLRSTARDGVLPRWSEWFGPGVFEGLVPDPERRAAVLAGLPRVPVAYFESRVPAPEGWSGARCGYLRLSEPYIASAAAAASRGWPLRELPGKHLDLVTRPVEVAEAMLSLVDELCNR